MAHWRSLRRSPSDGIGKQPLWWICPGDAGARLRRRSGFIVEWRFAEAMAEHYAEFAAELARLNADIFLAAAPDAVGPV